MAIVVARDSTTRQPSGSRPETALDEGPDRDRCLASAGQRGGAHAWFGGAGCKQARRGNRFPLAGRFSLVSGADLSGTAVGFAEPAADRRAHRSGTARCHSYRHRRTDRLCRARLLPPAPTAVHDELHDAIPRIYFGPIADLGRVDLCGTAMVPRRRDGDHGGDAVADDRADAARLRQSRHVDPRRRRRSVPPRSRHRSSPSRVRSS